MALKCITELLQASTFNRTTFESLTTQVQSLESFDSLEELQLNVQLLLTELASVQNITLHKATFPPDVLSHKQKKNSASRETLVSCECWLP